MKAKCADLNADTLLSIQELSTEWLSQSEAFCNVNAKTIKHHSMGHRMLVVAFDYAGAEDRRLQVPICFQITVSQLSVKKSFFSKREEYFFFLFQENELKPRMFGGALYQPQEILVDKFNETDVYTKRALLDELMSEGVAESLSAWAKKAKGFLS